MGLLAALVLRVLHFLYALISLFHSFWSRQTRPPPQPLHISRRRVPKNLALVFVVDMNIPRDVVEKTVLQSCVNVVEWCRAIGIPKLTIYEEHALSLQLEPQIRERTFGYEPEVSSSDSENEYQPLTPPASVYSDSRQLSPCHSMSDVTNVTTLKTPSFDACKEFSLADQPLPSLCLVSSASSKTAIAGLARSLYVEYKQKRRKLGQRTKATINVSLTVDDIDSLLENDSGLSSPDFMIVHPINPLQYNRTPLELHGFPPWHIRLTEIYLNQSQVKPRSWRQWLGSRLTYTPNPTILDEISFRYALDEYAAAEMRFGR